MEEKEGGKEGMCDEERIEEMGKEKERERTLMSFPYPSLTPSFI